MNRHLATLRAAYGLRECRADATNYQCWLDRAQEASRLLDRPVAQVTDAQIASAVAEANREVAA